MDCQGTRKQDTKTKPDLQLDERMKRDLEQPKKRGRKKSVKPTISQNFYDEIDQLMLALKYPCNKSGIFLNNFTIKCPFCKAQTFDRLDYFKLHYGQSHAGLYGPLTSKVIESTSENVEPLGDKSEKQKSAGPIRKRKRSCTYVNENVVNSDSEILNENTIPVNNKINLDADTISQVATKKIHNKKRKRNSTESHQTDDFNGYCSDVEIQKIMTCANEIQSILAQATEKNIELNKKITELLNHKKTKETKQQKTVIQAFKCEQCSTHFLKSCKWIKHLQSGDHTMVTFNCKDCGLNLSKETERKHMKMHEKISFGKADIKVTTGLVIASDNETSANTDDEIYNSNSEKTTYGVPRVPPTLRKAKGAITKNKSAGHGAGTATIQNRNSKFARIKLYQCDECEVNFFNKKQLHFHLKANTHHITEKKHNCDVTNCQLKFKNKLTLEQHKKMHHNNVVNFSKDDFKFIRFRGQQLPYTYKYKTMLRPFQRSNKTLIKASNKKKLSKIRKLRNTKKSTVPQSNTLASTEENLSTEPSAEVDRGSTCNEVESESCRLKLIKTASNTWSVPIAPNPEEFECNNGNHNSNKNTESSKEVPDCAESMVDCNVSNNQRIHLDSSNENITTESSQPRANVVVSITRTKEQIEKILKINNIRSLSKCEDSKTQINVDGQINSIIENCDTLESKCRELDDDREVTEMKPELKHEIEISEQANINVEVENSDAIFAVDTKDAIAEYNSDDSRTTVLLVSDEFDNVNNNEAVNKNKDNVATSFATEEGLEPKMIKNAPKDENDKKQPEINKIGSFSVQDRNVLDERNVNKRKPLDVIISLLKSHAAVTSSDKSETVLIFSDDEMNISDEDDIIKF